MRRKPGQAVFPCLSYHLCHCPHSKPCGYSASEEAPDGESEEEEWPAWSEPTHAKRGSVSDLKKESIRRQGRTRWMRGNKEGRIPVSYTGAGWPHMNSPCLASTVLRHCGRGFNCRNWFVTTRNVPGYKYSPSREATTMVRQAARAKSIFCLYRENVK
jgi:hypothetical protein